MPLSFADDGGLLKQGIVAQRPKNGRFVEIDSGFMVPYKVTIPGTTDSFWMEPIPAGMYSMGSPITEKGRSTMEGPQIKVDVPAFWIGRHEVTHGVYRHFMSMYHVFKTERFQVFAAIKQHNQIDAVSAPTTPYDPELIFVSGDAHQLPISSVTQYAAKQYTKWLSKVTGDDYRLPTEAEWEYACRAGTNSAWHFGNNAAFLSQYAWFKDNSYDHGCQVVGQLKPNAWGLYDMHGNVAEWVHDHFEAYPTTGQPKNAAKDWVRREKLDPKVVRGGSWVFPAEQSRCAARMGSDMEAWRSNDPMLPQSPWWCTSEISVGVGLRVVRPLKAMSAKEQTDFWEPLDDETKFDISDRARDGREASGIASAELLNAVSQDKAQRANRNK